ncbi:MAG: hypothetical protein DMD81_12570, partial [Candidatus Rokuibacteriota bacterium]
MGRRLWGLAFVVTFLLGLTVGRAVWKGTAIHQAESKDLVASLQQQVTLLEARLRAREDVAALRQASGTGRAGTSAPPASRTDDRIASVTAEERGRSPRANAALP